MKIKRAEIKTKENPPGPLSPRDYLAGILLHRILETEDYTESGIERAITKAYHYANRAMFVRTAK